jgi:hypothetical protein
VLVTVGCSEVGNVEVGILSWSYHA